MSMGAAVGAGAVLGLGAGIVLRLLVGVPFAPEAGLALGALVAWLWRGYTR
jgi:hypothetical protein